MGIELGRYQWVLCIDYNNLGVEWSGGGGGGAMLLQSNGGALHTLKRFRDMVLVPLALFSFKMFSAVARAMSPGCRLIAWYLLNYK